MVAALSVTSLLVMAQERTPAVREPLNPLLPQPVTGNASLPEHIKAGFEVDLAGVILTGDWSIKGSVTGIADEKIGFRANGDESGQLVYRLPNKMRLALKTGQSIQIQHNHQISSKKLSYDMSVTSGERLVLVASRRNMMRPPDYKSAALLIANSGPDAIPFPQVYFWSHTDNKTLNVKSDHGSSFNAPVNLRLGNGTILIENVAAGQAVELVIGSQSYVFFVKSSAEFKVAPAYFGLRSGGYMLEYFLITKER